MRRKLLSLIMGGALSIAAIAPAAAATGTCAPINKGGAAALVALVNANVGVAAAVCQIEVDILNNSLNNLLQNANTNVLSNILNNSTFLNNVLNNVTVTVSGNQIIILGTGLNLTIVPA